MPETSPRTAPHLLLAALGGTIASTANAEGGVAPALSGAEIAAAAGLDQVWPDLRADFTQVAQVSSANVTLEMLFDVVELARSSEADGIVLTQGTDTSRSRVRPGLLNDSGTHIAATGAMRNPTLPGADGPANVRSAALTALSDQVKGLPSTLVFNDEVHDPRFVSKSHTTSTAAFSSGPVLGAIGWLSEDDLHLPHAPRAPKSPFAGLPRPSKLSKVALAEVGMGEPEETLIHRRVRPTAPSSPGSAVVVPGSGLRCRLAAEWSRLPPGCEPAPHPAPGDWLPTGSSADPRCPQGPHRAQPGAELRP